MEPANKPLIGKAKPGPEVEFLPDADELERSPLPRIARLTLHLMVLALVSFVVWASFSEVERVVIAKGKLVNPAPNIVVQPLETSIIQSIDVKVGQVVKKGERLAMLDATFALADQSQVMNRMRSLEIQQQSLRAELSGMGGLELNSKDADTALQSNLATERLANYNAQKRKLEESIARIKATQETNKRDQQVLATRLKSLREREAMQEKLVAQNFGAKVNLLEAQDKRLEVERDLMLSRNHETELSRELAGLEADKSAFEKGWRQKAMEELLSITRERDALNEQLQKANKRHKLETVIAPADGVVLEITKLSQGSIVKEAEAMFTLVPLGAQMEAEVQIDSVDVGYIKPGDLAHVKLDAFPFQRHGSITAKVRTISEDAFRRENNSAPGMEAYYLSRINLGDAKLKNMTARTRLLPGMTLNAEIVVGKRSVMSYLIWPLTKALDESIREP
ncbi:MAG: HlyD family type I secretion periplasmic adaptor subunit [Burkholderiales bacterium]|nr:HlyD family type I secretion periplasmic adaptor subunit [Burkholderiales bacterium]